MMMLKALVKKSTVRAATGGVLPQTQISQLLKLTQVGSQRYFSNDTNQPVNPPKAEDASAPNEAKTGDAKPVQEKKKYPLAFQQRTRPPGSQQ